MPVYKSRVNKVSNLDKIIPIKKIKQAAKIKKKGGSIKNKRLPRKLPKAFTHRQAFNFVKKNPNDAIKIAQSLFQPKKGGGTFKTLAGIATGTLTGLGVGALAFREYLAQNPLEATKLAGKAVMGTASILGGNLSTGGQFAGNLSTGGSFGISEEAKEEDESFPQDNQDITGGALINPSLAISKIQNLRKDVKKRIRPKIQKIRNITKEHIDNFQPEQIIHMVQNMTPHEFGLMRGVASKFLNRPHPLDKHLEHNVGGNFKMPVHIIPNAMKDILRAQSPHFLAEALHSEMLDMKAGRDVGGGLFDSIRSVLSKGIEGGKKFTAGVSNVSKGFDSLMKRGILIAQAIEPLIQILDPNLGEAFSAALKTAQIVKAGNNLVEAGSNAVNGLLHGDVDKTVENISTFQLDPATQKKIEQSGEAVKELQKGIQKASELINIDDPEQAGDIDEDKLAELEQNIQLLDEANI